jgi:hypothetical protein
MVQEVQPLGQNLIYLLLIMKGVGQKVEVLLCLTAIASPLMLCREKRPILTRSDELRDQSV